MADREIKSLQEHMDERLDAIEKLINLSLVSSVINLVDQADRMRQEEALETDELADVLNQYEVCLDRRERFGDKTAVYIRSQESMNISKARFLSEMVLDADSEAIPIFIFEKMNGMQRKKLLEERISFCVQDKELYITG